VYLGLAVSLMLHAGLLAWALASIQTGRDFPMPTIDPIAVEFVTASDLTKMRAGSRNAKLKEAAAKDSPRVDQPIKETNRPRPQLTTPPPPSSEPVPKEDATQQTEAKPVEQKSAEVPPAEAKPQPDKTALQQKIAELAKEAGPTPEELKKIEDDKLAEQRRAEEQRKEEERKAEEQRKERERKAEEQRKEEERKAEEHRKAEEKRIAEEKRKAELKRLAEKKKAEEKKRREAEAKAKAKLDIDRLSALIDRSDPKHAPAAAPQPSHPTKERGPVLGDRDGRDQIISANEAAFLAGLMRQAVSRCWNINAGLDGIDKVVVKIQVRLSRDGNLVGPPRVVNGSPSPLFRDAAASAERALVQCAPYTLPPDKYEGGWEFMELTFDPQRMF
jgi:colicin import membrane protein